MLLKEKLAIDLNFKRHLVRLEWKDDRIQEEKVYLLTAKTRSSLFPYIDHTIKESFSDDMPEIYSLPIIHMDWDQAEKLKSNIRLFE